MHPHPTLLRGLLYFALTLLVVGALAALPARKGSSALADSPTQQNLATLPTTGIPASAEAVNDAERTEVISEAAIEGATVIPTASSPQVQPALSTNGQIAFVRGDGSLYIADSAGADPQRRASALQAIEWPEWSKTGEYLIVTSSGATPQERCVHIIYPAVDTTYLVTCGFTMIAEPRWSPNELRIAFLGRRPGDTLDHTFVVERGGGYVTRIMRGRAQRWSPAWLDDYTLVVPGATSAARDAWRLFRVELVQPDLETPISNIRTCSGCNCGAGDWMAFPSLSPDGTRVAFVGGRTESGKLGGCTSFYSVYLVNPWSKTIEEERVADISATGQAGPLRWSPDNQRVAVFGGEGDGRLHINLVDTVTRARRVLRSFSAAGEDLLDFEWAPDAKTLLTQYKPGGSIFNLGRIDIAADPDTISSLGEGQSPAWAANRVLLQPPRPLIFIPGVLGSSLNELQEIEVGEEFWPGQPTGCTDHLALSLNSGRMFVANDAIRTYVINSDCTFGWKFDPKPTYQPLIDALRDLGYSEYWNGAAGEYRTACDMTQVSNKPNLFVFAYDWRKSNSDSAGLLADYVSCVRKIHGPETKVDILTHSMGGLVARRYILNQYQSHGVSRLITVAAPWLGAPKAMHVMGTGSYSPFTPGLLFDGELKILARGFPGVYELLPSPLYYSALGTPLFVSLVDELTGATGCIENSAGEIFCGFLPYTYEQTAELIRETFDAGALADVNKAFHSIGNDVGAGQDDWRSDNSGVQYHHIVGLQHGRATIERLDSTVIVRCESSNESGEAKCTPVEALFAKRYGLGDETVPERSATRCLADISQIITEGSCPQSESVNLNASGASIIPIVARTPEESSLSEHGALVRNPRVIRAVSNLLLGRTNAGGQTAGAGMLSQDGVSPAPLYYLQSTGVVSVTVTDSEGRTAPEATTALGSIPGITIDRAGDAAFQLTLPVSRSFTVALHGDGGPLSLSLVRGDGVTFDEAIRYRDIVLPANTIGVLFVKSMGVVELRYDSDGDGTAETVVPQTTYLAGPVAADVTAPGLTIRRSGALSQMTVTIEASDAESGVARILYSVDGATYKPYAAPLQIDATRSPRVFAFAEDQAGNRSAPFLVRLVNRSSLPILRR